VWRSGKVIITCALTGSGHTPSMSPYLPHAVGDVIDQGVAAAEAGAAVLHLHARNPKDGSPSADPALFAEYAKGIKAVTALGPARRPSPVPVRPAATWGSRGERA
jgi:uncharacterized protein (DUF849 family)